MIVTNQPENLLFKDLHCVEKKEKLWKCVAKPKLNFKKCLNGTI